MAMDFSWQVAVPRNASRAVRRASASRPESFIANVRLRVQKSPRHRRLLRRLSILLPISDVYDW